MIKTKRFESRFDPETINALANLAISSNKSKAEVIEDLIRKAAGLPTRIQNTSKPNEVKQPKKVRPHVCKYCGAAITEDRRRSYCGKPECYQRMLKDSAAVVFISRS